MKAERTMTKKNAYKKPKTKKRKLGNAKGLFKTDKSFFDPLPEEILKSFLNN